MDNFHVCMGNFQVAMGNCQVAMGNFHVLWITFMCRWVTFMLLWVTVHLLWETLKTNIQSMTSVVSVFSLHVVYSWFKQELSTVSDKTKDNNIDGCCSSA